VLLSVVGFPAINPACPCACFCFLKACLAKLLKATIKLRIVCLSVRMGQLGYHWTDFGEI
jgi:hypothetical protein